MHTWSMSGPIPPSVGRGVASGMIRFLLEKVPGQHVGLQTDDAQGLYHSLGFRPQPEFLSIVVGRWLDHPANTQS